MSIYLSYVAIPIIVYYARIVIWLLISVFVDAQFQDDCSIQFIRFIPTKDNFLMYTTRNFVTCYRTKRFLLCYQFVNYKCFRTWINVNYCILD